MDEGDNAKAVFENNEAKNNKKSAEDSAAVFPIMSVVLELNKGRLRGLRMENMSEACPGRSRKVARLVQKEEGKKHETNRDEEDNDVESCPQPLCVDHSPDGICDLKLFVSWFGTDRDNRPLVSAGERFMRYRNNNLKHAYESMLKVSNMFKSEGEKIFGDSSNLSESIKKAIENPHLLVSDNTA